MKEFNEMGSELNGPRTSDLSFTAPLIDQYQVMQCTNIATHTIIGYLGVATNEYAIIVDSIEKAQKFKWVSDGSSLYLAKQTTPNDRYLGVGASDCACYGLWIPTGWVDALVYDKNGDKIIYLESDQQRKLYYDGTYVKWSKGEKNQNILSMELITT